MKYTKSLKKAFDFRKTLNYGKFFKGKFVAIYVLPRRKQEELSENLFGICVSKKHGNSVVRNRLKRWARESYTCIENRILKGFNIVVLFKKNIKDEYDNGNIVYEDIKKDIHMCLQKLKMVCEVE